MSVAPLSRRVNVTSPSAVALNEVRPGFLWKSVTPPVVPICEPVITNRLVTSISLRSLAFVASKMLPAPPDSRFQLISIMSPAFKRGMVNEDPYCLMPTCDQQLCPLYASGVSGGASFSNRSLRMKNPSAPVLKIRPAVSLIMKALSP